MVRPKTLAIYAAIIIAGLMAGYGLHALLAPPAQVAEAAGPRVMIEILKDGKVIYRDLDDPFVENWAKLMHLYANGGSSTLVAYDGTTFSISSASSYDRLVLDRIYLIEQSGVQFTRAFATVTAYAYEQVLRSTGNYVVNDTGIYINLVFDYQNTGNTTVSIYGIALAGRLYYKYGSAYVGPFVFAYDPLDTAVQVAPSEWIQIRYTLIFP